MAPLGAALLPGEQENTATCPICLCTMTTSVVSLGCGHLFHESCLTGGALRSCALCRAPVRLDRIKPASQVPGARTLSSTILDNWARRSGALGPDLQAAPCLPPAAGLGLPWHAQPPLHLQADLGAAAEPARRGQPPHHGSHSAAAPVAASHMPQPLLERLASWRVSVLLQPLNPASRQSRLADWQTGAEPAQRQPQPGEPAGGTAGLLQRPSSLPSGSDHLAADIPPLDSAALLEGIRLQLGAAAASGGAAAGQAGAARQPGTFAFCIDVSSSMGSSRAWQPAAVSRLCFALASLACVVDSQVAEGDWVTVAAFDAELAVLKRWFRKPASFDMAAFLAECTRAVRHSGLRRWGTRLCSAVRRTVEDQASQARAVASAAAADPAAAAGLPAQHSFVLLTDGDADDGGTGFEAAAALVRDPPFEHGGFRTLLIHIDFRQGRNRDWLRRLAQGPDGQRLRYVELLELALPARLNLTSLHSVGSSALGLQPSGLSMPSGLAPAGGDAWDTLSAGGAEPTGWPGQQQAVRGQAGGWRRAGMVVAEEVDDSMPVRAMSRAIHAFSSTLGSAPSSRAWRNM